MTEASGEQQLANGEDNQPAIGMISQYVKDLSFENPNAPLVYQWEGQPQIEVQFNIGTTLAGEDVHELVMKIEASAKTDQGTAFAVELAYGALFAVRNVPEDQVQHFMLSEAPRLVFPFARRIVADTVRDGGFPPLLLEPIDFNGLYLQQQEQAAQALSEPAGTA